MQAQKQRHEDTHRLHKRPSTITQSRTPHTHEHIAHERCMEVVDDACGGSVYWPEAVAPPKVEARGLFFAAIFLRIISFSFLTNKWMEQDKKKQCMPYRRKDFYCAFVRL